jgi:hypothetical protein
MKSLNTILREPQDERVSDSVRGEALEPQLVQEAFFITLLGLRIGGDLTKQFWQMQYSERYAQ